MRVLRKSVLFALSLICINALYAQDEVILISPEDGHLFGFHEPGIFRWQGPTEPIPYTTIYYTIRVVLRGDMDPQEAMETLPYWWEKSTNPSTLFTDKSLSLEYPLEPLGEYAWQVTRYNMDNEVIGISQVYTFTGPYPFEYFYADNEIITVTSVQILGDDYFSGTGLLTVETEPETYEDIIFDTLLLELDSGRRILREGEILDKIDSISETQFDPFISQNSNGLFIADSISFTQYTSKIKGFFNCNAILPAGSTDTVVRTITSWVDFENPMPSGYSYFENLIFNACYPEFNLFNSSRVSLFSNQKYKLEINGSYVFHNVLGEDLEILMSTNINNFTYYKSSEQLDLNVLPNAGYKITVNDLTIDCSEDTTYSDLIVDANWTGATIDTSVIIFDPSVNYCITVNNRFSSDLIVNTSDFVNRIDADGLNFSADIDTIIDCSVYGFIGSIANFNVHVENGQVSDDLISGSFEIPYLLNTNYNFSLQQNGDNDTVFVDNTPDRFYFPSGQMQIDTICFVAADSVFPFNLTTISNSYRIISLPDTSSFTGVFDFTINANNITAVILDEYNNETEIQIVRGETEVSLNRLKKIVLHSPDQLVTYYYQIGAFEVESNEILQDAYIYPNPVTDFLNLDLGAVVGKSNIGIFDVNGKNLFSMDLDNSIERLNLSSLESGTYFLKICNAENIKIRKFVKL